MGAGRRVIAFARDSGVPDPANGIYAPPTDIFVVSAVGGAARRLTDTPAHDQWPAYSPDGRWIAYGGYNGTITVVSAADPTEVLRTIRCGYPVPTPEDRFCSGLDCLPAVVRPSA
jgi:Tol biopolymer transport system component